MPKIARELTAVEVRRLGPGTHAVGGVPGLCLAVGAGEPPSRSWVLRTVIGSRRREVGLGSARVLGLGEAREAAREALTAIRAGRDPIAERREAKHSLARQAAQLTFRQAAKKALALILHDISDKGRRQSLAQFEKYVHPIIGARWVDEVGRADVLRVLLPIWVEKPTTALPLRARLEAILSWATAEGYREGDNPALLATLKISLPMLAKGGARHAHRPAVSLADAPAWLEALREREGMAARALEFVALTAARSGEVRGATWGEIDLDAALWTVPAERMKAGRRHRVPLTDEAIALLSDLPRMEGRELVFPAPRGGPLFDPALSAEMRALHETEVAADRQGWLDPETGKPATVHGLRATFKTWTTDHTEFPREMAEVALAHAVGNDVEQTYSRGDMMKRRKAMMAQWAAFLEGREVEAGASNVVGLRA